MKISGNGSVVIVPHVAEVPLVVKYFPPFPVCDGRLTGAAAHSIPKAAVADAVRR